MKITVTKEDISRGLARDCFLCPVALAIKRQTNKKYVAVTDDMIYVRPSRNNSEKMVMKTPKRVRDFIIKFDSIIRSPRSFYFELKLSPEK